MHGTPVELLHTQTEAVAYKPILGRPSARKSRYGIGEGRCGGCEPYRQELSATSGWQLAYRYTRTTAVLLLL